MLDTMSQGQSRSIRMPLIITDRTQQRNDFRNSSSLPRLSYGIIALLACRCASTTVVKLVIIERADLYLCRPGIGQPNIRLFEAVGAIKITEW